MPATSTRDLESKLAIEHSRFLVAELNIRVSIIIFNTLQKSVDGMVLCEWLSKCALVGAIVTGYISSHGMALCQ